MVLSISTAVCLFNVKAETERIHRFVWSLIPSRGKTLNAYHTLESVQAITEVWETAFQEVVCHFPKPELTLFTLFDVDIGSSQTLSKGLVCALIERKVLSPQITVYLVHELGNTFAFVLEEDVAPEALHTNKTCVLANSVTGEFVHARLGNYTRPNNLYHTKHLHGLEITLGRAALQANIHTFSIVSRDELDICDLPQ
jgi:hypothetical protein